MKKQEFKNYLENKIYGYDNRKYADNTIRSYSIKLEIIEKNFSTNLDDEYEKDRCHYITNEINSRIRNERNGGRIGIYGSNGHKLGLSSLEECRSAIKAYIDFKDNEDKAVTHHLQRI